MTSPSEPGLPQRAVALGGRMAKNSVLIQAGKAFGEWLEQERMTPERMLEALANGEPLLRDALASIPPAEVAKFRGGALGQAAREIREEEYNLVLRQAAMNPKAAPCASLLLQDSRLYWRHFVPAMNAVKRWFVDGTPL